MSVFICYTKCSTCKKAKEYLDETGALYIERDIKTDNPSYEELKTWLQVSGLPVKKFFNTSGLSYKSLGVKGRLPNMDEDECLKLLSTDGMLVKRPLLVNIEENYVLVGFKKEEWGELLG
ncbi:MAG: arsenate reductase family protein [Clostridiales bacterium]|jgi:arsenate reductase|nr:arsenate reductase family protein [Clostridiales bacterium]